MKKIILICIALIQFQAFSKVVEGEGRFYSQDEDSLNFIQKQLLSSAYKDVITKELTSMGLDAKSFWESYEQKFETYFEPIGKNLKEKYNIDVEGKKPDLKGYKKALRLKRLSLKSRYGALYKAISQYSEKSKSRSPQVPNARYIRIRAKVDRKTLHKIFLNFTADSKSRSFQKLYITSNFTLRDLSWTDMGVEVENDFTTVIRTHWEKWLKENLKATVEQIVFTDEADYQSLSNFMKIPKVTVESLSNEIDEETPVSEFSNSLWIRINVDVEKTYEKDLNQKRGYSLKGSYVLIDLNNQELLDHADFSPYEKVYSYRDAKALSSSLATFVYQLPMNKFRKLPEAMKGASEKKKTMLVQLDNFQNIKNVYKLQRLLNTKGITKQVSSKINFLGSERSTLMIDFLGSHDEMRSMFASLTGENIGNGTLSFATTEQALVFSLNEKSELETAPTEGNN